MSLNPLSSRGAKNLSGVLKTAAAASAAAVPIIGPVAQIGYTYTKLREKGRGLSGGADPSWTSDIIKSREKRSLERLNRSLDYAFNSDAEIKFREDIIKNNSLKTRIKEDIQELIGTVKDNPTTSMPTEKKVKTNKDLEDKISKLIKEQNKSSPNKDLSREISSLKGQLTAQQRAEQYRKQQPIQPKKETITKQIQPQPGQQPVKPVQTPIKPGQLPVKPVKPVQTVDKVPETDKKEPTLIDRLFGSSDDQEEKKQRQLDKDKEDFEKQKKDEIRKKQIKEKMDKLKQEEIIQTDLFKQLPDKSSPEYEKVKKLMIEQIKLIHKYNLLKQETFQLMLDNSKCDLLEEENKEQKEKIADLENKIFDIIKQILSSNTSNKGLNKLNRDLLGYISDLESTDPDGSLVDTNKYLELIQSVKNSSRKRTLRKVKKKQDAKNSKGENKKKTPNKLRKKLTPKKEIVKRTPVKPKITKVYKNKRTPTKQKKANKVQRTPTKPKK
jgi:hypothetical protein